MVRRAYGVLARLALSVAREHSSRIQRQVISPKLPHAVGSDGPEERRSMTVTANGALAGSPRHHLCILKGLPDLFLDMLDSLPFLVVDRHFTLSWRAFLY